GKRTAGRVRERWHGAHALHRRIFSQLSDSIYVWPIFEHWHGDIFKAELLRDGVVAVVAWHRADPLALRISKPWLFGIVITERAGPRDEIELDIQRRGICSQQFRRIDAKQLAPEFTDI